MRISIALILLLLVSILSANGQTKSIEERLKTAREFVGRQEYQKAKNIYRKLLESRRSEGLNPDSFTSRLYYNLGVCEFKSGRLEEAESHFSTAVEKRPNAGIYFALALVQIESGKTLDAKRNLFRVISKNAKHGEAWFELGLIYFKGDRLGFSTEAFKKSIRYSTSRRASAVNNLGVIYAIEGDQKKAENSFRKAIKLSKGRLREAAENLRFSRDSVLRNLAQNDRYMISKGEQRKNG